MTITVDVVTAVHSRDHRFLGGWVRVTVERGDGAGATGWRGGAVARLPAVAAISPAQPIRRSARAQHRVDAAPLRDPA